MKTTEGQLQKTYYADFSGGQNSFIGVRQIQDNESPDASNCDFLGKGGIGNRQGYTQIGTPATYTSGVAGMGELHTASLHQLLAFKSNGASVVLSYSTDGGSWTNVTGTTFQNKSINGVEAANNFYIGNGADTMQHWDGAAWNVTTNGTIGYLPVYYNNRIWLIDDVYPDRLNFSGQYMESTAGGSGTSPTSKLGDFSDASSGWVSFKFGSGAEITGLRVFKNALYVFLRDSIYSVVPATSANTFTISLVTNAIGCVSARSIAQVGEDLYFAADDGVYSLGDVANFVGVVRSTAISGKIQQLFVGMTAANKAKLVGEFYRFKYHLFYSVGGTVNDSCFTYDTRYKGWLNWTNMSASEAMVYISSDNTQSIVFGHPTSSSVYTMYSGSTDDGATISSYWYSKSFDQTLPDIVKLFMDSTFVFGTLSGTVNVYAIFNDSQVTAPKSISQGRPQGGFGRDKFGLLPLGDATNTLTITNYVGQPLRMRAKGQKFAIQYKITSSGIWRLDTITQTFIPFTHYKFNSTYKIN